MLRFFTRVSIAVKSVNGELIALHGLALRMDTLYNWNLAFKYKSRLWPRASSLIEKETTFL